LLAAAYLAVRHGPWTVASEERSEPADNWSNPSVVTETVPAAGADPGMPYAAGQVRAMSPMFRNSTLLIAIRGDGYRCDDVVSATESAEGVWVASCADRLGYTLSVREIDRFDVEPIPHYFDGLEPRVRVIER
jgi:hypothetical protein